MTLPYSISRARYLGNGTATVFPFSFKVWKTSQLDVILTAPDGSSQPASGWTAQLNGDGGAVTYLHDGAPLPAGWQLAIVRNMPFTQNIDLVSATRFDPAVMEDGLDQAAAERQQLLEQLSRAVILPPTSEQRPEDMAQELLQVRQDSLAASAAASASAVQAAGSAAAAQASEQAAATSAGVAGQSAAQADANAEAASQCATAAGQSAEAAAQSRQQAAHSAASIHELQVTVDTLSPGLPASADYDPATGMLHLGIPKGDAGDAAIATPISLGSVKPQTGDNDGLELEADGTLRVRAAGATQRGSVLASVTAQTGAAPLGGAEGKLDGSWFEKPPVTLFNSRLVITESNAAWTPPVTGWARVTVIGGGGSGGNDGKGSYGGNGGKAGGQSSFGSITASGGAGGGGGGSQNSDQCGGGGGGGAGHVATEYVYISSPVKIVIGAGATQSSGQTSSIRGGDGSGDGHGFGGNNDTGGTGAAGAGNGTNCGRSSYSGAGGSGGLNGTGFGGGGGGAGGARSPLASNAPGGAAYDGGHAGTDTRTSGTPVGGNGGAGAVIVEYHDPAKEVA